MPLTYGPSHPQRLVLFVSLGARLFALLIAYLSASVSEPFDSSPLAVASWINNTDTSSTLERLAYSLLRWDAFHFAHVAQKGYVYEYEYAFLPGTPTAMRLSAELARWLGLMKWEALPSISQLLVGGFVATIALDPSLQLYQYVYMNFAPPWLEFHRKHFAIGSLYSKPSHNGSRFSPASPRPSEHLQLRGSPAAILKRSTRSSRFVASSFVSNDDGCSLVLHSPSRRSSERMESFFPGSWFGIWLCYHICVTRYHL